MNILVVDDEKEIAELVAVILKKEGHTVFSFLDGKSALACIASEHIDLAVLDVMLPDIDGFEILRRIRKTKHFPVIMLTAKTERRDKLAGLSEGADDYITKPFDPLEFTYRVRAALRRATDYNKNDNMFFDKEGLTLDFENRVCSLLGKEVPLTATEFKILWTLCCHAGQTLSPEEIYEAVWHQPYLGSGNTVMVHIRRIREKLGENVGRPKYIKTVWGVGYTVEKS